MEIHAARQGGVNMPTRTRLIVSNVLWTILLVIIGLGTQLAREQGFLALAEIQVAVYIMLAFPSGLGWYDLSIGRYRD
jgi:hypothetical protein